MMWGREKKRFRRKCRAAAMVLVSGVVLCCSACASGVSSIKMEEPAPVEAVNAAPAPGAIWAGENAGNMLFSDKKARYVNDVVTIVIEEETSGQNKATTKTEKTTSTTAGIAGVTQASPDKRILSKYELGGSSTNSLDGSGDTTRDGKLEGTITARVVKVLDNGNLMVQGKRQLTVNEEDQYIVIAGVVRPDDIAYDNTVSSKYVADARIIYTGKGVVNDKMRPGWLTRVVDWVWPF